MRSAVRGSGRRALLVLAIVWAALLAVLAVVAATGRVRVVPAGAQGEDVGIGRDALVLIEPVPTPRLGDGDVFLIRPDGGGPVVMFRVTSIDSWSHEIVAVDQQGEKSRIELGSKTWRVTSRVPHGGRAFRLFVGPVQSGILVLVGLALIVRAESRRRPRDPSGRSRRLRLRRSGAPADVNDVRVTGVTVSA